MVRVVTALFGLLCVALVIGLAIQPVLPLDKFLAPTISAFEAETGTALTSRSARIELLPTPTVVLDDIRLDLPDGLGSVAADQLSLALDPLPFLSGYAELSGIAFDRPEIELTLPAANLSPLGLAGELAGLVREAARLNAVARDGRIALSSGKLAMTFDAVTLAAGRGSDGDRLSLDMRLSDQPFNLVLTTAGDTAVTARLTGGATELTLAGTLAENALSGKATLAASDALGVPGALHVDGAFSLSRHRIELTDAATELFGRPGQLEAALDLSADRPAIDIHADLGRLPAEHLVDLVARLAGVGVDPLAGTTPFDAGLDLKIADLALPGGSARDIHLTAVGRGGRFGLVLDEVALGNGRVGGRIDIGPDDGERRLGGLVDIGNVALRDIAALAGIDLPLGGKLSGSVRLSAHGRTAAEFAATLAIDGSADLADGRLTPLQLAEGIATPALTGVSANLSVIGLDRPARLTAGARAPSGPVALTAELTPRRLFDGGRVPLSAMIDSDLIGVHFDGTVDLADLGVSGALSLDGKQLASLFGNPAVTAGSASLDGTIETSAGRIDLREAKLLIGENAYSGPLTLMLGERRPRLSGRLSGDAVDIAALAAFLAAPENRPGAGLSGAVDADLRIEAAGVSAGPVAAAAGPVEIAVGRSAASVGLPSLSLGGGSGTATLTLSGTDRAGVRLAGRLDGARLASLSPLIGTRIDGRLMLDAEFDAKGQDMTALLSSASGKLDVTIAGGVIDGLDPMALITRIADGVQTGLGEDAGAVAFDGLAGKLSISDGIARTDSLALTAGDLAVSGSGSLKLADGTLDLRLKPTVSGFADFELPVAVTGTLTAPQLQPDFAGMATDAKSGYAKLKTGTGAFARLMAGTALPKLAAPSADSMASMIDALAAPAAKATAPAAATVNAPLPPRRPAGLGTPAAPAPAATRPAAQPPAGPLDLGAIGAAPAVTCNPGSDGRCIP